MSSVDAVSDQGVHIAGGGSFGGPGDNPLTDTDGDGIYYWYISLFLRMVVLTIPIKWWF